MNLSLLSKTAWKILHSPTNLCIVIVRSKYFKHGRAFLYNKKQDSTWVWKSICYGLDFIDQHYFGEVRNGLDMLAFRDNWFPNPVEPLYVCAPNPNF